MSINFRDTSAFLCCIGCWKPLPGSEPSDGASQGERYRCCGRTYDAFFVIRSGPEEFRTGWRLVEDALGPVGEDGT